MPILVKDEQNIRLKIEGRNNFEQQLDDSLTSLQWLQEVKINLAQDAASATVPTPYSPAPSSNGDECLSEEFYDGLRQEHEVELIIDYKTNPHCKPPYSYATLICMAMKEANLPKMTLSAIYKWITNNFVYYKYADQSWQNSIRHNLSLNKCFVKVPRKKGEPGKGGYWSLVPEYADKLLESQMKKRKMQEQNTGIQAKRARMEKDARMRFQDAYRQRNFSGSVSSSDSLQDYEEDEADNLIHVDHNYGKIVKEEPQTPTDPEAQQNDLEVEEECSLEFIQQALTGDFCWNTGLSGEGLNGSMRLVTQDLMDARRFLFNTNSPYFGPLASYELGSPFYMSPPPSADDLAEPVEFTDQPDLTIRGISMPIHNTNFPGKASDGLSVKVEPLSPVPSTHFWDDALDFTRDAMEFNGDENLSEFSEHFSETSSD